jgi:hypothetical protein
MLWEGGVRPSIANFFFVYHVNDVTDTETASCILHSWLVPYPVPVQFQQHLHRLDLLILDDSW